MSVRFNYDPSDEHLMNNFFKKRFGRDVTHRNGSKRNRRAQQSSDYQALEPRKLLATLTVNTVSDVVDLNDGLISLREAITAANTNAAYGDAPAGSATGDAIHFASSLADQTITLDGSALAIDDDLIIRGGNTNITISGDQRNRVFVIETDQDVVLSKLHFTAGKSTRGGALLIAGGGTVRLFKSHFSSSEAVPELVITDLGEGDLEGDLAADGDGGAVYNLRSRLLITDSSFTSNNANRSGGAIFSLGGQVNFLNSSITDNFATASGGGFAADGGEHNFAGAMIENNRTEQSGGGLYITGTDTTVLAIASTIDQNFAANGGGVFLEAKNRLFVFGGTTVSGNTAQPLEEGFPSNGGGIFSRGFVRIGGSELSNNTAILKGGAIFSENGELTVSNSDIDENQVEDDGGGIAVVGSSLVLQNTRLRRNATTGVRFIPHQVSSGGALHIGESEVDSSTLILGSSFQFNTADDIGGAIFNAGNNTTIGTSFIGGNAALGVDELVGGGGGGIYNLGDVLKVNSSTIQNNSTKGYFDGSGGGIFSAEGRFGIENQGLLEINFSSILRNRAEEVGGGIAIFGGEATLFNSNVGNLNGDGNRAGLAPNEPASASQPFSQDLGLGGGIWAGSLPARGQIAPTKLTIFGGVIASNVANRSGAGLYTSDAEVTFRAAFGLDQTMVFANRSLVEDGGGLYANGGNLNLIDAVFEENTSRDGGGIFATGAAELRLAGSKVQLNEARRTGGGLVALQGAQVDLADALIESNNASFFPDVFQR